MTQTLYDPPSGWKYGFPRPYLPKPGEALAGTLLRDGYPQLEIDNGGAKHCRFIGGAMAMSEKSIQTSDTVREHSAPDNDNAPVRERYAGEGEASVYAEPHKPAIYAQPDNRIGDWIQTYSGAQAYPMDLRPSEIHIEDIAHSLSMQCRYTGHCLWFYSVAEHSVLIAEWLLAEGHTPSVALAGLLHDATEAFLTDVPRPVKPFLLGYKDAEQKAWLAIAERFGVGAILPSIVHEADNRILVDEVAANMTKSKVPWSGMASEGLGVQLEFWTPDEAEKAFKEMFWQLVETGRM